MTSVDRLKADPFAFYAQAVLGLRQLDPVDADHSAAWKGTAVHKVLEEWLRDDDCDPAKLVARAGGTAEQRDHPSDASCPVAAAVDGSDPLDRGAGAREPGGRSQPLAAERRGEADIRWHSRSTERPTASIALADGSLAIVDYKTGKAPTQKAVDAGFSLQLGIARHDRRGRRFPGRLRPRTGA